MIREMGFRKGEDFYIALGQAKLSPKTVTSKLMHRLKEGEAAVEPASAATELLERKETPKKTAAWAERDYSWGQRIPRVDPKRRQRSRRLGALLARRSKRVNLPMRSRLLTRTLIVVPARSVR